MSEISPARQGSAQNAVLLLEDGTRFDGVSFGAPGEICGEVVFNTAMTGYQEIATDPSYFGQLVTMTYPLIGNYGVNAMDTESRRPFISAMIVREIAGCASNYRCEDSIRNYFRQNEIMGIEGVDTRALTLRLRDRGAMRGILSTADFDSDALLKKVCAAPQMEGQDCVKDVTGNHVRLYPGATDEFNPPLPPLNLHVVAYDFGIKTNILRQLAYCGIRCTIVPAHTGAAEIRRLNPDGVFLSNGPGDPFALPAIVKEVRALLPEYPTFGICLGCQIMGLALGGKTGKLKFGHRGANHPVKDLATGRIEITSQNHGFYVQIESLPPGEVEVTHTNLNDQTVEGLRHKKFPAFSVQYHPEASPGPHDSHYLFQRFRELMESRR